MQELKPGIRVTKIRGLAFTKALTDAGLIPSRCTRVILDAQRDGMLVVIFETLGGEEWIGEDVRPVLAELRAEMNRRDAERAKTIEEATADERRRLEEAIAEARSLIDRKYRP